MDARNKPRELFGQHPGVYVCRMTELNEWCLVQTVHSDFVGNEGGMSVLQIEGHDIGNVFYVDPFLWIQIRTDHLDQIGVDSTGCDDMDPDVFTVFVYLVCKCFGSA